MKQIFFGILICLVACRPQSKESALVILPPFSMLLMDSTTLLKAQDIPDGRPIVLLFFRPDCPHCQEETRDILAHIDSFQNVQFYMLALEPLRDIREFNLKYHIAQYRNFTIGKDQERSFLHTFRPATVPYIAIYDGNKKLVKIYNGGAEINYLYKATHI